MLSRFEDSWVGENIINLSENTFKGKTNEVESERISLFH